MRGRLARLFILLVYIQFFGIHQLFSQGEKSFASLPKSEQKVINKHIKSMSAEDKILAFTCLEDQYANNLPTKIAGIVTKPEKINENDWREEENRIIFINPSKIKRIYKVPFPSYNTRKISNIKTPHWLPQLFDGDYLIDFDTTDVAFYGLDTTEFTTTTSKYYFWEDLITAILNHDLIYSPASPASFLKYIRSSKISRKQEKLLNTKLQAKITANKFISGGIPSKTVAKESIYTWVWNTYSKSLKRSNNYKTLPLSQYDSLDICSFSFAPGGFAEFNRTISKYIPISSYTPSANIEFDVNRLSSYDLVIMPVDNLNREKEMFARQVAENSQIMLVHFNSQPDSAIERLSRLKNIEILTIKENNWLSQSIAGQSIFGAYEHSTGTILQYGIPELAGLNPDSLAIIDDIITLAIEEKAMPGCQVLIAKNGLVVWDKAYGYQTYDSIFMVNNNTLFDLASITKVLATTQGVMYLFDEGILDLDKPLSKYLPYLKATNKQNITTRQVMAHQAGLYPYYPFWKRAKDELINSKLTDNKTIQIGKSLWVSSIMGDSILSWAAKSDLLADRIDSITHEQYFYSDIGFYFLKDLIEKETNLPFDVFLNNYLYRPMGTRLRFNPTCYFPTENIAPTEVDDKLRHETLKGFVHDRNAALMGGIAGQAGLFGNANDVAKILQLQLNKGTYAGQQFYKSTTIEQFLSRQYDNNRRALGWDRPGPEPNGPVSSLAADETFGHSGFTGGLIWADPKESIIFVFLSNRVYPSAENTKLIDMNIRTRIQDIVYKAIINKY